NAVRYLGAGLVRASSPWHINALTKKTERCTASSPTMVLIGSKMTTATSAMMNAGCTATTTQCGTIGWRANTMTKVKRYSASGRTQRSGPAATSVEMCAVTATRRPAGTAARAIQEPESFQVGGASTAPLACASWFGARHRSAPQAASSAMRKQKPIDQDHA